MSQLFSPLEDDFFSALRYLSFLVSVLLSTVATDVYQNRLLGQPGDESTTDGLTIQQQRRTGRDMDRGRPDDAATVMSSRGQ
ncbi:hypothetical protein LX32DRAFT_633422 [Colletotrichum zoysiae]|uniref:Uncharacterized protein n=1 Tax=Colletotrichum zoysiae TaxID=1216348 RepID=A0AAD9HTZ0_9PEZI|nr:hypothetical protein LX32DRAFT_633422 [Colletotrichum zoysiae]